MMASPCIQSSPNGASTSVSSPSNVNVGGVDQNTQSKTPPVRPPFSLSVRAPSNPCDIVSSSSSSSSAAAHAQLDLRGRSFSPRAFSRSVTPPCVVLSQSLPLPESSLSRSRSETPRSRRPHDGRRRRRWKRHLRSSSDSEESDSDTSSNSSSNSSGGYVGKTQMYVGASSELFNGGLKWSTGKCCGFKACNSGEATHFPKV